MYRLISNLERPSGKRMVTWRVVGGLCITLYYSWFLDKYKRLLCCSLPWFWRILNDIGDPTSAVKYYWLCIMTVIVVYNSTVIIARVVFSQLQNDYHTAWLVFDYVADAFYVLDMIIKANTRRYFCIPPPAYEAAWFIIKGWNFEYGTFSGVFYIVWQLINICSSTRY